MTPEGVRLWTVSIQGRANVFAAEASTISSIPYWRAASSISSVSASIPLIRTERRILMPGGGAERRPRELDLHAPRYQPVADALAGWAARQHAHRIAWRGVPSIEPSPTRAPVAPSRSATPILIFGVAEAKSRKVCRFVRQGANASALSSETEPGVTLKIRSLASASSWLERTSVTPASLRPALDQLGIGAVEGILVIAGDASEARPAQACAERAADLAVADEAEPELLLLCPTLSPPLRVIGGHTQGRASQRVWAAVLSPGQTLPCSTLSRACTGCGSRTPSMILACERQE